MDITEYLKTGIDEVQSIQEYRIPHSEANLVCYTYYNSFSFIYLFIMYKKYYDVKNKGI